MREDHCHIAVQARVSRLVDLLMPAGLPYTAHRFKVGMADIYLVAHNDRETGRASWSNFMTPYRAFMADYPKGPDAMAAVPRTAEDNRFLVPTDYSARR